MEPINKLQPDRTIHLRGFDDRGAGASLHSATPTGFTVSGVFRDPADFAVVMLWDADCFFEHPRLKYLPDFDFSGMVLEYDVTYTGIQPLDSAKFPTIDWPYLDAIRTDGTSARIPLFANATQVGGGYSKASADFLVTSGPAVLNDRVTLWYQNFGFDYTAGGGELASSVATLLASYINGVAWGDSQAIEATVNGATIHVAAQRPGQDGNLIGMYAQSKTGTLAISPGAAKMSGGSSAATWHVKLDFSALGIDQVRQLWLTFAPALSDGKAYASTEWTAVFSNWKVTDPLGKRPLKVAGPNSVRVEDTDFWCTYSGKSWATEAGFYSQGFAQVVKTAGDSVSLKYTCQVAHDLWFGTSLYVDRGKCGIAVDGAAEIAIDTHLNNEPPVNTRRIVQRGLKAGAHTVAITHRGGGPVYFDFIEAAVASDVPDAPGNFTTRCPANDNGTDHGYKLSPARLLWNLEKLGFTGPMNLYVSVFWWNQRVRAGAVIPSASVDFSSVVDPSVFLDLSGFTLGKSVFPADTPASIAQHFAYFLNESSVGVYAQASGNVLTVTNRAATSAYAFALTAWSEPAPGVRTPIAVSGSLSGGKPGLWMVDPTQTPPINRGTRDWLADVLALCKAKGRAITLAYSMELLNPPDDPASGAVWASRFADGTPVMTSTGFATNVTTHCAFSRAVTAYQIAVFLETADLMAAAGLPVELQVGEFLFWYFPNASGMAYYDDETKTDARAALGHALHVFKTPNDDPALYLADATFLANRLDSHIRQIRDAVRAKYPGAVLEILLPLDVLSATPVGHFQIGGALNNFVSIPASFYSPAAAPFDRVKIECLDFGASTRSTDLVIEALASPVLAGWPLAKRRYLIPVFNGGCPWQREYLAARDAGVSIINYWAFDHFCLFGWDVAEPVLVNTSSLI
jgi:hypothetical protein